MLFPFLAVVRVLLLIRKVVESQKQSCSFQCCFKAPTAATNTSPSLGYIYFLLGDQLCLIEMFHLRAACTKNKSDEDDEEDQDGDDCHEDPNQRGHLGEKN